MGDVELRVLFDEALAQIARPRRIDERLTPELRQSLCQLGMTCDEFTPRAELFAQVWTKKRGLAPVALAEPVS
jgi:hypothetical protein